VEKRAHWSECARAAGPNRFRGVHGGPCGDGRRPGRSSDVCFRPMECGKARWRAYAGPRVSNVRARGDGPHGTITAWIRQNPELLAYRCVCLVHRNCLPAAGDMLFSCQRNLAAPLKQAWEMAGADRIEADSALAVGTWRPTRICPVRAFGAVERRRGGAEAPQARPGKSACGTWGRAKPLYDSPAGRAEDPGWSKN